LRDPARAAFLLCSQEGKYKSVWYLYAESTSYLPNICEICMEQPYPVATFCLCNYLVDTNPGIRWKRRLQVRCVLHVFWLLC